MNLKTVLNLNALIAGLLLASATLCCSNAALGQAAEFKVSNRWLLIVETSRSMQSRAENTRQIAAGLVASGVAGQMRPGDSLGLWTFNDSLRTGEFPLQRWSPSTSRTVAQRVHEFLEAQKNDKEARTEKVGPELTELLNSSDFITVVLLTSGSSAQLGTSVDDQVAASFKAWQGQQEKNKMPFVTVLRAQKGKITGFVVNTPPFPLELPALPEELFARVEPPPVSPETAKPPAPTLPPLILSGRKPEQAPQEPPPQTAMAANTTAPEPPKETTTAGSTAPAPSASSKPATDASALPLAEPATTPASSEKPIAAQPVSETEPPPAPAPAQAVAVESGSSRTPKILILSAGVGLAMVAALMVMVARRNRASARASLITRSLDRREGPH